MSFPEELCRVGLTEIVIGSVQGAIQEQMLELSDRLLGKLLKTPCKNKNNPYTLATLIRGCSSVVERHVANVNVVGSNLITRFF